MANSARTKPGSYGAAAGGTNAFYRGPADYFKPRDWSARCDQCFTKYKASEMFLRWDNARVCWQCNEIRNPQDFVRGVPDAMAPPWTRPTPPPVFVGGTGATGQNANETINTQIVGGKMPG